MRLAIYTALSVAVNSCADVGWSLDFEVCGKSRAGEVSSVCAAGSHRAITSIPQDLPSYNLIGSTHVNGVFIGADGVFVGTDHGLSLSKDAGETWKTWTVAEGIGGVRVQRVFATRHSIYLAVWKDDEKGAGLSASSDGGRTWRRFTKHNGLPSDEVFDVFVQDHMVLCATSEGVAISSDGGNSWRNVNLLGNVSDRKVLRVFSQGTTLWAATSEGLFMSKDQGKNWSREFAPNGRFLSSLRENSKRFARFLARPFDGMRQPDLDNFSTVFDVFAAKESVYAATFFGLFSSSDGGNTWLRTEFGAKTESMSISNVKAFGTYLFAAAPASILISSDQGRTWRSRVLVDTNESGFSQAFLPQFQESFISDIDTMGRVVGVATDVGLFLSADSGETWAQRTAGLLGTVSVKSVAVGDRGLFLATEIGLVGTNDQGASWEKCGDYVQDVAVFGDSICSGHRPGLWCSFDHGSSWIRLHEKPFMRVSHGRESIYAVSGVEGFGGELWQFDCVAKNCQGKPILDRMNGFGDVRLLDVFVAEETVYAVSQQGMFIRHHRKNGWVYREFPREIKLFVKDIYVAENGIYIAGWPVNGSSKSEGGGVAISRDEGKSWIVKTTSDGIASNDVNQIIYDQGQVFAATSRGLSISADEGEHWVSLTVDNGLSSSRVNGVSVHSGKVYIATSRGLNVMDL